MSKLVDLIGHVHFPNLSFDARQNCGRFFYYVCAYVTSTTGKSEESHQRCYNESHNFYHESDDHYH